MTKQLHVLLIEDDAWLRELEVSTLEAAGFSVTALSHALAAMEQIDVALPDVIISDVLLAGSTAFSLFNELQSHADTKAIPVVLCTNIAERLSDASLTAYNVKRVVDKTTMNPGDLVTAVRAVAGAGEGV